VTAALPLGRLVPGLFSSRQCPAALK